nr:hypothetical protein [Streptomyces sp. MBT65]
MDSSTGLIGDFVGGILDKLEKLTVAVSALSDTTFSVGVLGHEARVDGIGLEDSGGLFENGSDHSRGRRCHCSNTPVDAKVRKKMGSAGPAVRIAGPSASVAPCCPKG